LPLLAAGLPAIKRSAAGLRHSFRQLFSVSTTTGRPCRTANQVQGRNIVATMLEHGVFCCSTPPASDASWGLSSSSRRYDRLNLIVRFERASTGEPIV
jgi:hypothetical protein